MAPVTKARRCEHGRRCVESPAFLHAVTSHLQKFPDSGEAASHADHNAARANTAPLAPELEKGITWISCSVSLLSTPRALPHTAPTGGRRRSPRQQAQHEALIHKGQRMKPLVAPTIRMMAISSRVKGGELDGVGDDEHRHYEQDAISATHTTVATFRTVTKPPAISS